MAPSDDEGRQEAVRRVLASLRHPARLRVLQGTGLLEGERVEALERVARLATLGLGVPLAQVNFVTGTQQVPVAAHAAAPRDVAEWRRPVGLTHSYCQYVVAEDAPLVVEDAPRDARVCDNGATRDARIGAYLGVPLRSPDAQVLGSLCVVDFEPRRWHAEDLMLLDDLAAIAATEIALRAAGRASAEEAARAIARTERLQRLADDLARPLGRREAARRILAHVAEATAAGRAAVYAPAPGGALAPLDAHGDPAPLLAVAGRAAAAGAPAFVADGAGDGAGVGADEGAVTTAALPLVLDDRVLGVLALGWEVPHALLAGERAFLLAFARHCAFALERARLLDVERDARADADAARAEAEAASRAKSDFVNVLSHELRSPVNAIVGHAQLLEMGVHGPVSDRQHEALGRIGRSAHLMGALVDDLLELARIEHGQLTFALRDVPAAEAVEAVAGAVRPQLEAKRLALTVDAGPPGLAVRADPGRLQQILLNLLTNAVKFTERGAVAVRVGEADGAVRVEVRDTGVGIPAGRLAVVFDRFVQVDQSLTRRAGGLGLGLAIARDLARGMGGDVTVESAEGEGSAFTLSLPRA
jgi:signal transduction histidine kinase